MGRLFLWMERNRDLVPLDNGSAAIRQSGLLGKAVNGLMGLFLLANLVVRFETMFNYPPYDGYIAVFLGMVVSGCVLVVAVQKYLKAFLFFFGFSFFLFGFPPMTMQSRIFEIIVTCVVTTLFFINLRAGKRGVVNRTLLGLIVCYVVLSLFSLLLLPIRHILRDISLFGLSDFFFYMFIAQPYHIYYPIPAITRLVLFVILAVQLASLDLRSDVYKSLFMGLFSGGIFSALIGILDLYGIISLQWYRFGRTRSPGVLHSTFWNRGVFGEFILCVVPFVLVGFLKKKKTVRFQVFLFASLVVCEIALLLAGARAGWVSYPLILLICWVFFYFSKEGKFNSFHFKWKNMIKLAVSAPLTILVSFLIIYFVFLPFLKDYQTTEIRNANNRRVEIKSRRDAKNTTEYIENKLSNFTKTGRLGTWHDSINVGLESPFFGVGYESYCWHSHVLDTIPNSRYKSNQIHKDPRLTPHNTYISLFTSGGIVGFSLWLMLVFYAMMLLVFDLIKNKKLFNIPVIISIIGFHTYGFFQSMQYIPMIWCIIFLNLGYAMTNDASVLPGGMRRWAGVGKRVAVFMVLMGLIVYASNFESRNLAEKYDRRIYAVDENQDRFGGFFQLSYWNYGDYRWFGKRGVITFADWELPVKEIPENREQSSDDGPQTADVGTLRTVEMVFRCVTPDLAQDPLVLKVFHNGAVLDEIVFSEISGKSKNKKAKGQTAKRKYELPVRPGQHQELLLEVSRTWIPHAHLGNFDRREFGVGVKVIGTGERKEEVK